MRNRLGFCLVLGHILIAVKWPKHAEMLCFILREA